MFFTQRVRIATNQQGYLYQKIASHFVNCKVIEFPNSLQNVERVSIGGLEKETEKEGKENEKEKEKRKEKGFEEELTTSLIGWKEMEERAVNKKLIYKPTQKNLFCGCMDCESCACVFCGSICCDCKCVLL